MTQPSAVNKGLTMGIVILKSMHESKEKLAIVVHGTTDIASENESKGFGFSIPHLQLNDLPSVFDRLPDGPSEVKAISLPPPFPTS